MPTLHVEINNQGFYQKNQPPKELIKLDLYVHSPFFGPAPIGITSLFRPSIIPVEDGQPYIVNHTPQNFIHVFDEIKDCLCIATNSYPDLTNSSDPMIRYIRNAYLTRSILELNQSTRSHIEISDCNQINELIVKSQHFDQLIFKPTCIEHFQESTQISSLILLPGLACHPSLLISLAKNFRDKSEETDKIQYLYGRGDFSPDAYQVISQSSYYLLSRINIVDSGPTLKVELFHYQNNQAQNFTVFVEEEPCSLSWI